MDQKNNEKIKLAMQILSDGILIFDENDKLEFINPKAEDILGIKKEESLGDPMAEITPFPKLKPVMNFFDHNKSWGVFKKEVYNDLASGKFFEANAVSLLEHDKKQGTLILIHDITRGKNIEKMKDEFISLAAHQLRTPLSAIRWTLSILAEQRAGSLTTEQQDIVDKSYQSTTRMITLVNDLLDVTRLEEGKYVFTMTLESLQDITQDVIYNTQMIIKERGVKLEFEKPDYLFPKVKMDKEKIKVVIENLIENAIKYTPSGKRVTISLESNKMNVEFKVVDEGIGIPENQQAKIFTKFFRSSNAVKAETDGSGLGLYLSKNIIDAHYGQIGFSSEEGKGTTFWFKLPVKEEFEQILERF